jgi:hypothetical protein
MTNIFNPYLIQRTILKFFLCLSVFRVTGDVGIEVLPYVPVMFEGMDRVGGEYLTGLANWI